MVARAGPARRAPDAGDEAGGRRRAGRRLRGRRLRAGSPRRGALERRGHREPLRRRGGRDQLRPAPPAVADPGRRRRRAASPRRAWSRPRAAASASSACTRRTAGWWTRRSTRPSSPGSAASPAGSPRPTTRAPRWPSAATSTWPRRTPTCGTRRRATGGRTSRSPSARPSRGSARGGSSTPTGCTTARRAATRGGTTAPATSTRTSGCASITCSSPRRWRSAPCGRRSTARRARASRSPPTTRRWSIDLDEPGHPVRRRVGGGRRARGGPPDPLTPAPIETLSAARSAPARAGRPGVRGHRPPARSSRGGFSARSGAWGSSRSIPSTSWCARTTSRSSRASAPTTRALLDRAAYAGPRRALFEYWGHEASLLPVSAPAAPALAHGARRAGRGVYRGLVRSARRRRAFIDAILAEVAERGPLAASELTDGGRSRGNVVGLERRQAARWSGSSGAAASRRRPAGASSASTTCPNACSRPTVLAAPTPPEDDAQRSLVRARRPRARGGDRARPAPTTSASTAPTRRRGWPSWSRPASSMPARVEGWTRPAYLDRAAAHPGA